MLKSLVESKCINIERLLVLSAKELKIDGNECHILLLIYTLMEAGIKTVTPQMIQNYSMLTSHDLNKVLQSLLNKKLIYNRAGSISLNHLEDKLLQDHESASAKQEEESLNIVTIFEEQFGRPLSPIELNIIKDWKESDYSDEMIVKALKEAVKSQVLNFRYVEGILNNWAKNGIKQRYVESEQPQRKVPISEYKWWDKEKTNRVLEYFDELFPDAYCELNHESDFQLLVAVMLSAQTTDKKVNQLTENLFKKYPTVEAVSQASLPELEQDIKTIGLYRNKAKNLLALSHVLIEQFDGIVPSDQKQLESLPGVGRKTANVVRSVAFDIPAFAVDTHVERISKRLGFAKRDDNVLTVEKKLCRSIPRNRWNKSHHQFIFFGRYFCKATNPSCTECKLVDMCKDPIKNKYL